MELLFLIFIGFLPTWIAGLRHHHNTAGIFMLNLFLGWTGIFWIVALIWACTNPDGHSQTIIIQNSNDRY